jgi:hypothetical protein
MKAVFLMLLFEDVDWIHPAEHRVQWQSIVNGFLNGGDPPLTERFWASELGAPWN